MFQLTIFSKKIGLSRHKHTLQGDFVQDLIVKTQRTSAALTPKRDAKRKTCCVPAGARQNVVVVGL